eukprot:m.595124 g.595124  ORF g.595124 m.595124 type:complete len:901 (-) comp58040_c0_seq5:139-2841(-)
MDEVEGTFCARLGRVKGLCCAKAGPQSVRALSCTLVLRHPPSLTPRAHLASLNSNLALLIHPPACPFLGRVEILGASSGVKMGRREEAALLADGEVPDLDERIEVERSGTVPAAHRYLLLWTVLLASALLAIGGGYGLHLLDHATLDACTADACAAASGSSGCFTPAQFTGLLLQVFLIPIGVLALAAALVESGQRARTRPLLARLCLILILSFCVAISAVIWTRLVRPEYTWSVTDPTDSLWVILGTMMLFGSIPVGLVALITLFQLSPAGRKGLDQLTASLFPRPSVKDLGGLSSHQLKSNISSIVLAILYIIAQVVACSIFAPIWNDTTAGYLPTTSTYAYGDGWTIDSRVQFKLFEDIVVFYSVLMGIIIIGATAHFCRPLRNLLQLKFPVYRVAAPSQSSFVHNLLSAIMPRYIVLAEVGGLAVFIGLTVYWVHYWRFEFVNIENAALAEPDSLPDVCCGGTDDQSNCSQPADPHASLQTWARVMGLVASMFLGLALYPVARNSLWERVFGIPFERALKYHRFMGLIAYLAVCSHAFLWWIKWGLEGTLAHNLVSIDSVIVSPLNTHYDNFTIFLAQICWVLLTIMIFFALFFRRRNYELFYYTHFFSIIFMIAMCLHAWGFWFYTAGGLFLWLVDRCIRLSRRAHATTGVILAYNPDTDITEVTVSADAFQHEAGQYAFLHFPSVSALEWHPFTISSAPSAPHRKFHIKNMGKGTWTYKLSVQARLSSRLPVYIDAPYGRTTYYTHAHTLVMVAGGIGITPLHSIISELSSRKSAGLSIGNIQAVHLIWATRSYGQLALFAQELLTIMRNNINNLFHIELYCSMRAQSFSHPDVPQELLTGVRQGRPNIAWLCNNVPAGPSTVMLVCGPQPLVDSAQDIAFANNFTFHSEEFYF